MQVNYEAYVDYWLNATDEEWSEWLAKCNNGLYKSLEELEKIKEQNENS